MANLQQLLLAGVPNLLEYLLFPLDDGLLELREGFFDGLGDAPLPAEERHVGLQGSFAVVADGVLAELGQGQVGLPKDAEYSIADCFCHCLVLN